MTENNTQQLEELEALSAIYGSDWRNESQDSSYNIQVASNVQLFITFIPDYPSNKPPTYQLLAPTLSREKKELINISFMRIYKENHGGPVVFQWIEELKDIVSSEVESLNESTETESNIPETSSSQESLKEHLYHIEHGSVIKDRKSTFQGHACLVKSQQEVKDVMDILLQNKKVAQATHNILAYRIRGLNGSLLQDCDDDGETHAGGRLLHLLQIIDVENVMVVVSRWYGGVNLGPDRFRHINNAGRQVLQQAGFIKNKT